MKRGICVFVVLLLLLCGCTGQTNPSASKDHFIIDGNRTYVAPFGEVPAAFQFAIDNGILKNAKASKDRIFTTELVSGGYQITMYDLSFKQLVSWQSEKLDVSHYVISELLPTSDGGFLFSAEMHDHYIQAEEKWASEYGYRTMLIKCASSGNEEFRYEEDKPWYICAVFEKEDGYLAFGTIEAPETKTLGVYSPTDVYLLSLNKEGSLEDQRILGGTDYDFLRSVENGSEGYILFTDYQSKDGVPKGAGYHKITVNTQLEILDDAIVSELPEHPVGAIDGKEQYNKSGIFEGYPYGTILNVIDYGDYYLVLSKHVTGIYENQPPQVSTVWSYYEMVYSAYSKDGTLLWIATEDVSPDYDSLSDLFLD